MFSQLRKKKERKIRIKGEYRFGSLIEREKKIKKCKKNDQYMKLSCQPSL